MIIPTQEELVMGERKFLHEMANQIFIAHGMVTRAKNSSQESSDLETLEKALTALNKMTDHLRTRRSLLHEISNEFTRLNSES